MSDGEEEKKKIILHSFQQMSVLDCRVQRPVFRGVSGCLEKYVLVEGMAKLAGPNMDIVDVFCFFFSWFTDQTFKYAVIPI